MHPPMRVLFICERGGSSGLAAEQFREFLSSHNPEIRVENMGVAYPHWNEDTFQASDHIVVCRQELVDDVREYAKNLEGFKPAVHDLHALRGNIKWIGGLDC